MNERASPEGRGGSNSLFVWIKNKGLKTLLANLCERKIPAQANRLQTNGARNEKASQPWVCLVPRKGVKKVL
jgi:hypothetical protein